MLCLFHQSRLPASISLERPRCLNSQTHEQETANALLTLSACVHLYGCMCANASFFPPLATFFPSNNLETVTHSSERFCSCRGARRYSSVFLHCHSLESLGLFPIPPCCCPKGLTAIAAKHSPSRSTFTLNRRACVNQTGLSKQKMKKKKKSSEDPANIFQF